VIYKVFTFHPKQFKGILPFLKENSVRGWYLCINVAEICSFRWL